MTVDVDGRLKMSCHRLQQKLPKVPMKISLGVPMELPSSNFAHRDLSIHIEGELTEIKLRPIYYRPEMGRVKTRKLDESKNTIKIKTQQSLVRSQT